MTLNPCDDALPPADAQDIEALLKTLVLIDSRNPDLAPDSPGEKALAEYVAAALDRLGCMTSLHPVAGDRPNVVGILPGTVEGPAVVLEAHLDTVPGAVGPAAVRTQDGRLHARGACDAKGSLAAMLAAVRQLAGDPGPRPAVIVAALADEEYIMRGAARFAEDLGDQTPVRGVVIGEPTSLQPVRAHNGYIRAYLHARGEAVHSSRAHVGSNAVVSAARAIVQLDEQLGERLRRRDHPVTGPALLTATMISGGVAPNIVPDRCDVCLDRRLAPDEDPEAALQEIREVLSSAGAADGRVELGEPLVALRGVETAADHPFVRTVESAVESVLGAPSSAGGVAYSTDGCHVGGRGGLPCVVLGPGSIEQAHTADEWVDLKEVSFAAGIYAEIVRRCATEPGSAR